MDAQAKRVLKEVNANPGEQGYTHMVKKPGQLSDDVTQLPTELPGFSKERYYQLYWRLLFSFWGFPKSVECWMSSVSAIFLSKLSLQTVQVVWEKSGAGISGGSKFWFPQKRSRRYKGEGRNIFVLQQPLLN